MAKPTKNTNSATVALVNGRVEDDKLDLAKQLLAEAGHKLMLPVDHIVAAEIRPAAPGAFCGSGGAILLQAPTVTYVANQLSAKGGVGGQGVGTMSTPGGAGSAGGQEE